MNETVVTGDYNNIESDDNVSYYKAFVSCKNWQFSPQDFLTKIPKCGLKIQKGKYENAISKNCN